MIAHEKRRVLLCWEYNMLSFWNEAELGFCIGIFGICIAWYYYISHICGCQYIFLLVVYLFSWIWNSFYTLVIKLYYFIFKWEHHIKHPLSSGRRRRWLPLWLLFLPCLASVRLGQYKMPGARARQQGRNVWKKLYHENSDAVKQFSKVIIFFLKHFFSNFSILKALESRYCISP